MRHRVLLVDDHRIVRDGLRNLLTREPWVEVVGEAADGLTAVDAALRLHPDLVIMDLTLPGLNGFETTRRIAVALPRTRVVILSMHSDHRFVEEAFAAGAAGFVVKEAAFDELVTAVREVLAGRCYLSGRAEVSFGPTAPQARRRVLRDPLTPRERSVLRLIAEGHGTRRVAELLTISVKTVETHRRNIMEKLGLHNVAELTKYAVREGLTSLESPGTEDRSRG